MTGKESNTIIHRLDPIHISSVGRMNINLIGEGALRDARDASQRKFCLGATFPFPFLPGGLFGPHKQSVSGAGHDIAEWEPPAGRHIRSLRLEVDEDGVCPGWEQSYGLGYELCKYLSISVFVRSG